MGMAATTAVRLGSDRGAGTQGWPRSSVNPGVEDATPLALGWRAKPRGSEGKVGWFAILCRIWDMRMQRRGQRRGRGGVGVGVGESGESGGS